MPDHAATPSTPTDPGIVAALDLGSNTIKMTLGRLDDRGRLVEFGWASETVRLGAGAAAAGRLADDRIAAAMATLTRFADAARDQGAGRLVGVATEATRSASNGAAFLDRVRTEAGWRIGPISGDEEAALTFRGLAGRIDIAGTVVIADIGGGSTELIVATDGAVGFSRSYPVGSGALTDRHVHHDPATPAEVAACQADAATALVAAELPDGGPVRLVAVGGTGTYLAAILGLGRGATVPWEGIAEAQEALGSVTAATVAERLTIPEARARVLPAGIAVVAAVAERLGRPAVTIAPSGIRTGLLLRELGVPIAR